MSDTPILEATAKALYKQGKLSIETYHYLVEGWLYRTPYLDFRINFSLPPVKDPSSLFVFHGKVLSV
jgi:hypothetical protein